MTQHAVTGNLDTSLATGLPERYLCRSDLFGFTDADGFLDTSESLGLVELPELLRHWCSLVLAPPWMGKTYVSEAMYKALQTGSLEQPNDCGFSHVSRTCFELPGAHDQLPPSWWDSWRRSDNLACWIIDAVDEGHHRQPGTGEKLLSVLEDLDARERSRLRVLIFSRQKGLPKQMPDRLAALDVHHNGQLDAIGFSQYQFGPLTREEATRIVNGPEALELVVQTIRQCDLQAEVRYPKVLEHLATLPSGADVTTDGVWRSLLMQLLTESNANRQKPPSTEVEDRFAAAAHIAAVLTLTGKEEFHSEGFHLSGLCLNDIVPHPLEAGIPSRQATCEALDSVLFSESATGHRFAQRNIQEKLCAFGLKRMRLSVLKPMMANSQGYPFEAYVEVLNFLGLVSEHDEVRMWVSKNTDLLESDSPRLSLSAAKHTIDRLVEIAKKTPHYLYDVQLQRLAARGIGIDLRRRLHKWVELKPSVLRLLLDISALTNAREVIPLACKIARNNRVPIPVRMSAVRVVMRCGANDDAKHLESLAMRPGRTEARRNLAAAIIRELLDKGIWDVTKAARYALPKIPSMLDSRAMLINEIKKRALVSDAHAVIRQFLKVPTGITLQPIRDPDSLEEPKKELLFLMVDILLEQEQLTERDLEVLAWAGIHLPFSSLRGNMFGKLIRAMSQDLDIRRQVYEFGFRDWQDNRNSDKRRGGQTLWRDVLQYEDIEWLSELAEATDDCPELIWRRLLCLAYQRSEGMADALAQKRRVGLLVREHAGHIFEQFQRTRAAISQDERRIVQRRELEENVEIERYKMGDITQDIIALPEHDLQQKLWRLSRICFVEPSWRPSNIDGHWSDLSEAVRGLVLGTCLEGLMQCEPTPIPDDRSYTTAVLFEASAFISILRYMRYTECLTPDLIKKWLPTVFRASPNEQAWVCRKCFRVSTSVTRAAALDWIDRELQQKSPSVHIVAEFPAELWDESFADNIVHRIENSQSPTNARTQLIEDLVTRSPEHAMPLTQEWVSRYSWEKDEERPLLQAALNGLLAISPQIGWPIAKKLYKSYGAPVILALDALELSYREKEKLAEWPSDALGELGIILYKEFPFTTGEHNLTSGGVSRLDEARWARDRMPSILLSRGQAAHDSLQRLGDAVPSVKKWLNQKQAEQAASRILHTSLEQTAIELPDVLRILSDANYRLIRSDVDLLTVLFETLTEQIGTTVGNHLYMLYAKPTPKKKSKEKKAKKQREHLIEDALQSYVTCRLGDLLPGKILHKETEVKRRGRTDILVESPTLGGPITAVVIEVKWSDNPLTKGGLVEQLGKRYLLEEKKNCGIYLVGRCDGIRWPGLKDRTVAGLLKALKKQAKEFGRRHVGINIQPVVLDLRWSDRE